MQSVFVPRFCNELVSFLEKLENRFPEIDDIAELLTGVKLLKKTKPELLIKEYYKYVYVFKKYIDNEDQDFFSSDKFKKVFIDNDFDPVESTLKIEYFKDLLVSNDVDSQTKKSIWSYLKLLNKFIFKIKENKEIKL